MWLSPASIVAPVCGLNASSLPPLSTAKHWVLDGHETAETVGPSSTV